MSQAQHVLKPVSDEQLVDLLQNDEEFAQHYVAFVRAKDEAEKSGNLTGENSGEPVALDFLDDFEYEGRRLTLKQKLFVCEFLVDLNAYQAYQRAGYATVSASRGAYELLQRPKIRAAIQYAMHHRMERLRVNQDRVVREFAAIAFFDPIEVLEGEGDDVTIKDLRTIPKTARKAIKKITTTRGPNGTTTSVEFYDKQAALTALGKHMGMFQSRLVIEDKREKIDALEAARRRVIEATKVGTTYQEVPADGAD